MTASDISDHGTADAEDPLVESAAFLQAHDPNIERDAVAHGKFIFVRRLLQVSRLWRTTLADALRPTSDVQRRET